MAPRQKRVTPTRKLAFPAEISTFGISAKAPTPVRWSIDFCKFGAKLCSETRSGPSSKGAPSCMIQRGLLTDAPDIPEGFSTSCQASTVTSPSKRNVFINARYYYVRIAFRASAAGNADFHADESIRRVFRVSIFFSYTECNGFVSKRLCDGKTSNQLVWNVQKNSVLNTLRWTGHGNVKIKMNRLIKFL